MAVNFCTYKLLAKIFFSFLTNRNYAYDVIIFKDSTRFELLVDDKRRFITF